MGQSRWTNDGGILRKLTPSLPIHESTVTRNAQELRWWKIVNTLLCRWGERLKLVFAQLFLLFSSVSTEQSQIVWGIQYLSNKNGETRIGKTIWPIVWASKFVDENTCTFDRWSCARRSIAKVFMNEWKGSHNKIVWLNFVLMQDSWQQLESDSNSWQRTLKNSHNEYTLPRDEKPSDPKGWIRGNTKIGPVLEVTTSYLKSKYGVEIRMESVNKDNSHSWVRNFSWLV